MDGLIVFLVLAAIIGFWWSSATAYEKAYQAAKQACATSGVNFLDDTLERTKLSLCRHIKGYMQFCREYSFEFSTDGEMRYQGLVKLKGSLIDAIDMEAYRVQDPI